MNTLKKLFFTLIIITALSYAQQAQAQETKEYVTVTLYSAGLNPKYSIAYPDGTTEDGELDTMAPKTAKSNGLTLNGVFNRLGKKGYRLVSNGGGDYYSYFVFEK